MAQALAAATLAGSLFLFPPPIRNLSSLYAESVLLAGSPLRPSPSRDAEAKSLAFVCLAVSSFAAGVGPGTLSWVIPSGEC